MTADTTVFGEVIVGVDAHAEPHAAVAIDGLGRLIATLEVATTVRGYRHLARWASGLGRFERAGVEGCGAYGAGLARTSWPRESRFRGGPTEPATASPAWQV